MVEGRCQPMIQSYSFGSISMTCYNVGPDLDLPKAAEGVADLPGDVPADQTNT
jgi:4,5-DOPA dioxygenase extradiol